MKLNRRTKIYCILCVFTLLLFTGSLPAKAMVSAGGEPAEGQKPAPSEFSVTLEPMTISAGRTVSYETVASSLAGNPFAEGYYPGTLTVEFSGQLIIEAGGTLAIGTLSLENEKEAKPVLRGQLRPDGLIVVKPGGRLLLKNTVFELEGEGLFLLQEPGGSIEYSGGLPEEGLVQWAPPVVDNSFQDPPELWLEEGEPLTEDMLPDSLQAFLQYRGEQQFLSLPVCWDMERYTGQTAGELTLSGSFLNEAGELLLSVLPLEASIHWVSPEKLTVTSTAWLGGTACSAKLRLKALPEEAREVWGEISSDNGKTWARWESFEVRENGDEISCIFSLPDGKPRLFRVRASSEEEHLFWISEGFLLPKGEAVDQGGNRGGGTALITPSRAPAPTPDQSGPQPSPTSKPAETGSPSPKPTPRPSPQVWESTGPEKPEASEKAVGALAPVPAGSPAPSTVPAVPVGKTEETTATPRQEHFAASAVPQRRTASPALQWGLAAAGIAVCALVGMAAARLGPFRRRKT